MAKPKKVLFIAQLHFRIGILKEFLTIGDFISSNGVTVRYLLAHEYIPHIPKDIVENSLFIGAFSGHLGLVIDLLKFIAFDWLYWIHFSRKEKPSYFLLYFVHPTSFLIFLIGRLTAPTCRFGVYVHEPSTYKPAVTSKARFKAYIREWCQYLNIRLSHDVLLLSEYGKKLFDKKYPFKGKKHIVHFVFPSIELKNMNMRDRVNISNTLYPDGRSRLFSEIILTADKKYPQIKFRLVSSRIDKEIEKLLKKQPKNFELVNPRFLSDNCIFENIQNALVQLIGHRNITQSGVLPIAFQCGTPVLSRDLPGFSQFIRHKESGYLVSREAKIEEWFEGIHYIIEHFDEMSRNCLEDFEKYFAPHNLERYYGWLIDYFKAGSEDRPE